MTCQSREVPDTCIVSVKMGVSGDDFREGEMLLRIGVYKDGSDVSVIMGYQSG